MGQPACWWADQVTWARRCQAQAEAFALAVNDAVTDPSDPYAAELRRSRYAAAKQECEAWEQYARDAETAFQSAAEQEMEAADEIERRQQARDERHRRYPNTVTKPGVTLADDIARRNAS